MTEATTTQRVGLSGQDRDCAILSIGGMTCGSCANAVQRALSAVPGAVSVNVELGAARAMVRGSARVEDLLAAVRRAGYRAALGPDGLPESAPKAGGCGCGC